MWPLLWPSRPAIAPSVIQLFFWVGLCQASQGMSCPLGKQKADSPELAHCWALLESCLVEIYLLAALWSVEKLGWCWQWFWGGVLAVWQALSGFWCFQCISFKPFLHLDVLFGLASNKGLEMDLATDDCKIWHLR